MTKIRAQFRARMTKSGAHFYERTPKIRAQSSTRSGHSIVSDRWKHGHKSASIVQLISCLKTQKQKLYVKKFLFFSIRRRDARMQWIVDGSNWGPRRGWEYAPWLGSRRTISGCCRWARRTETKETTVCRTERGAARPSACETIGLWDHWSVRWPICETTGLSDQWSNRPMVC